MPASPVCPHCRTALPEAPPSGICPLCGTPWDQRPGGPTDATHSFSPAAAATPAYPGAATPTAPHTQSNGWRAPPHIPNYRDLSYIAGGGMGVVFRATQCGTERVVAIKVINGVAVYDTAARVRFGNEMQALGRVKHPNVVQVYDTGTADDTPFYSMEYVGGGTLAQRLTQRAGVLTAEEAARLMAAVAEGVQAAHQEDVLHRDLKPGNILLTEDGAPKVADFGLAKFTDSAFQLTVTGSQLGTPPYMAPEQIRGTLSDISQRTDVYGLGATLYECLTGRPPFRGATPQLTTQLVLTTDPAPPCQVRPDVPRELEAVCLKCLAKDPARRFATAGELAAELRRWLAGEPTLTQPPTRLQRIGRWTKRHRVTLGVAVLALAFAAFLPKMLQPAPPPPPPPTERELIEQELAAGRPVTLIGESGEPRWHDWHLGKVSFGKSIEDEIAFGMQSVSVSLLGLGRDPMTDSYEFSANIRHEKKLSDADGFVGLFVGMHDLPIGRADLSATRFLGFTYSEYWLKTELIDDDAAANHGLDAIDWIAPRYRTGADTELGMPNADLGVYPFPPLNMSTQSWRTISVVVTPQKVEVYWGKGPARKLAHNIPAQSVVSTIDRHNRAAAKNKGFPGLQFPATPWTPRGAYGLYVFNSAAAFQNVTIRPIPTP